MSVILAIIAGVSLGYILERGNMCFHSTIRGIFRQPREMDLFRAYLLTLLIATPLVASLSSLGLIAPWIPPFAWQANIVGGLIFGIGMVIASSCITGLFYKLGHGMVGTLVALLMWGIGDYLTYRGPLSPFRDQLNQVQISVGGQSATLLNMHPALRVSLIVIAISIVIWLIRSPRQSRNPYWNWVILGMVAGLCTGLSWLVADWGGSNYPYGTSGVPTSLILTLTNGDPLWAPWITISLFSIVFGAFVAARRSGTLWVRGETVSRYGELAMGGLLMGVGSAISGGCNLGHSLIGVPLLSLGSITTTLSIVVGIFVSHHILARLKLALSKNNRVPA
ncbi:MAG: YeeE/YedE family protein [Chloroflexota bacterium]